MRLKPVLAAAQSPRNLPRMTPASPAVVHEPARDIPVACTADVVVCGAGPAGVAAAVAAARTGARTVLLEAHGCLGGIWTSGQLAWIIDTRDKPGLMAEITAELDRRGARRPRVEGRFDYAYDIEEMKLLLDELTAAAGVRVRLHTRVAAALRDSAGRLRSVLTESKSGREAWTAPVFIDATGDGDLAALAGCGFDLGRPSNGECQPMSLVSLVCGPDPAEIDPFIGGGLPAPKERLLAELRRAGVEPSYTAPTLFHIRDNLYALMANHEYGVSALDADAITVATTRARAEVNRLVNALRGLGGPWSRLRLVSTPAQIGVREGRRIHGLYSVSENDLLSGARHADAVCRVNFGIDVHSTARAHGGSFDVANRTRSQPYDIPLRALIAKDADGLLLAGRCISGDFIAHSSYRITGAAVALGQTAGVTAALAAAQNTSPRDVPFPQVRSALDRLNSPTEPIVL